MIVLSPEQNAAILTPGNLLVRAGAGSGKTEVLARRFVALVAGDIEGRSLLTPAEIAAITFTEKAAFEMRERIAAVLEQRIRAQSDSERRSHLMRARATLPLARISTIHAFCSRILRENALDAGIDPDFEVLDEYESQTFLQRVCKQILIDKVRQADAGACYLARARRLESGSPREGAVEIVMRVLDEVARLGLTPRWLYEMTCEAAARLEGGANRVEFLAEELSRQLDLLLAVGTLSPVAEETIAPLRNRKDEFQRRIRAINAHVKPEALDVLRELCECVPKAQGRVKDCVSAIRKLVKGSTNGFGLDGDLVAAYGACRAVPRAREIAAMIRDLALKFDSSKAEERVVTFDDLLFRTRQLFESSAGTRLRYQTMLRALLVDEFQDTDTIQHAIVARLIEPNGTIDVPEIFIVGDEKQSIYRFRGADVAGFGRIRDRLGSSRLRELPLLGNRRSSPNIVRFVNGIGAMLMRSAQQPAPAYWVEWNAQHELSALRRTALDPAVEIILAIPDYTEAASPKRTPRKLSAATKRILEGRALGARIDQLVGKEMIADPTSGTPRPVNYSDIVILLRAFTDVAIYERALLDSGIPCYTIKGRGFFACQEVLDLIELLAAVDDPADSLALAAALRSPLFALSDDCLVEIALHDRTCAEGSDSALPIPFASAFARGAPTFSWLSTGRDHAIRAWEILNDLRKLRQRGTIAEVVEHALAVTGYEAVMLGLRQGTQRVANLRKLRDLAHDFESRRLFTFHDFVTHLRRLAEQQPYEPPAQILGESENVVRLMTVHQAKGLEFPVVFVADAGRKPDSDNRSPVVDPHNGLLLREVSGSGMDEIPSYLLTEFRKRSSDEQAAESLRLLYVALTRARDRLIISEGATVQGWAREIRKFVGAQTCNGFIQAGGEQHVIDCDGAKIALIRPQPEHPSSAIPIASDSDNGVQDLIALAQRRLGFEPPRSHEMVISPTALADFDRCPRLFHFRHSLKLPEDALVDESSVSGASKLGTVAHAVLEQLHFETASEEEIRRLTDQIGTPAGVGPSERSMIVADLVRFTSRDAAGAPAAREVPFFCHLGDTLYIRGQIDALFEQGDSVIVRDYKYARAGDHIDLYQIQMEAYALAVADAYPESNVRAEIVFLRDEGGCTPVRLPLLPDIRARILALGRSLAAARANGDFPRKPPGATVCRRMACRFVGRCWDERI